MEEESAASLHLIDETRVTAASMENPPAVELQPRQLGLIDSSDRKWRDLGQRVPSQLSVYHRVVAQT